MTRIHGEKDHWADPEAKTPFDFDPSEVCPSCYTIRAKSGACLCL